MKVEVDNPSASGFKRGRQYLAKISDREAVELKPRKQLLNRFGLAQMQRRK